MIDQKTVNMIANLKPFIAKYEGATHQAIFYIMSYNMWENGLISYATLLCVVLE